MTGKREINFSHSEKVLLLNLVFERREILENKRIDGVSKREKEYEWVKLHDVYNSKASKTRGPGQLKKCYENLKKRLKKLVIERNIENQKPGGGSFTISPENAELLKLYEEIRNSRFFYGIRNNHDNMVGDDTSEANQADNQSGYDDTLDVASPQSTISITPEIEEIRPTDDWQQPSRKTRRRRLTTTPDPLLSAQKEKLELSRKLVQEEGEMRRNIYEKQSKILEQQAEILTLQKKQEELKLKMLELEYEKKVETKNLII